MHSALRFPGEVLVSYVFTLDLGSLSTRMHLGLLDRGFWEGRVSGGVSVMSRVVGWERLDIKGALSCLVG